MEHIHNPPGIVTVSAGTIVAGPGKMPDLDRLYKTADKALYQAKENGRNTFVIA